VSAGLTAAVAALGPSVMEPPLAGRPGQPPYSFGAHPSGYLAVALAAAAIAAGTLGLGLCLHAARRGWRPPPRLLLAAGLIVAGLLVVLPPFGSADHLSYAAYGRMLVTGHDPYATGPDVLGHDPVGAAVEDWRTIGSVYGPLATAGQALASLIAGTSVRLTVFLLSLLNLAAFAGTGLLLHALHRGNCDRQLRAALLWTCNPLLLYELMAGAHVDSQAIVFAVAAVAVFPSSFATTVHNGSARGHALVRCLAAGAVAGLGAAVKLTAALAGGGLAWVAARRSPAASAAGRWRWLVALAAGFAVIAAAALAAGGPDVLRQVARSGRFVSIGSPWRAARTALASAFGAPAAGTLVSAGSLILALVLLCVLLYGLPAGHGRDDAARGALAFTLAWLFAWPYVLPWYDAQAWALLALVAWSWVDWLVLARTAALAVGYLPARGPAAGLPAGLGWLQSVVRTGVTPVILALLTVVMVIACLSRRDGHLVLDRGDLPAGVAGNLPRP
jgi:hypothetical protein